MSNTYFQFKQFTIQQDRCAMKVTTDACLFGAWVAEMMRTGQPGTKKWEGMEAGTGTGLLSLMLAQKNPGAIIHTLEIDPAAASQALENVAVSPWKDRINVIAEDIRNYAFPGNYDFIISNPPFYENELKSPDSKKNAAHHGDYLGLPELFAITRRQLSSTGKFYFLLPYKRKDAIMKILPEHSLYASDMIMVKQSPRHAYFRMMIAGGLKEPESVNTVEITIRDESEQYSGAFTSLLKDYYLYL